MEKDGCCRMGYTLTLGGWDHIEFARGKWIEGHKVDALNAELHIRINPNLDKVDLCQECCLKAEATHLPPSAGSHFSLL